VSSICSRLLVASVGSGVGCLRVFVSLEGFVFGFLSYYVKCAALVTNDIRLETYVLMISLFISFEKNSGGGGGGVAAGGGAEEAVEEEKEEEEEMDLGGGMDMFGGEEAGGGDY
jgi:hypothetical protein